VTILDAVTIKERYATKYGGDDSEVKANEMQG